MTSPRPPVGRAGILLRSRRARGRRRAPQGVAALCAAAALALIAVLAGVRPAAADWAPAGSLPGLGGGRIWSIAFGSDAKLALAGTDAGVYRSTDAGQTWELTSERGAIAWAVGVDTYHDGVVYAGLAGGGIARSTDQGSTWTAITAGLPDRSVRAFAFGTGAMAAATDDGVAVSTDGVHWRPDGLSGYAVSSVAVVENAPAFTLVAGADGGNLAAGFLFRGAGGTGQWTPAQSALPTTAAVSAIAAGPLPAGGSSHPLLVLTDKGAFRSGDGGTTWSPANGGVPQGLTLTTAAFSPVNATLVYAAGDAGGSTGGGLLRSTDAGSGFSPYDAGLPGNRLREVESVAVSSASTPRVLAAIDPPTGPASIYRLDDGGAPGAGGTAGEPAGAALGAAAPTAAPTAAAGGGARRPATSAHPATNGSGGAFAWPFPLALELLVLFAGAAVLLRQRLRYLDVEGPP